MLTQTTLKSRPYAGEADLQPICDLLNLCNDYDKLDEGYNNVEDLRIQMEHPDISPERDLRFWEDATGALAGVGFVRILNSDDDPRTEARAVIWVHPQNRGVDLENEILDWALERARQAGQEHGRPVYFGMHIDDGAPEYVVARQALMEEYGLEPVRYFFKMVRPLNEPIPEPQFPEGYTMRHSRGLEDAAAWVDAFNRSFIDHWNFHTRTVEAHANRLRSPNYNPELDLLAIAPDGNVAGFCFCEVFPEENEHTGRSEGWIGMLGTCRGYRNIGLGRAMLLAGMHRLKAEGIETAALGVDAENPTGAVGLYERVGFTRARTRTAYNRDL
jgi:mycothiol synthase